MAFSRLILLRHGETEFKSSGKVVAGWEDCALSASGQEDAREVGSQLKKLGVKFNYVVTSELQRSVHTAWLVCMESENYSMPIMNSWRLNERHYGALQGLTRSEMTEKFSAEVLSTYTDFNTLLPEIPMDDPAHPANNPRYKSLPRLALPSSESLAQTAARVKAFWHDILGPVACCGGSILVVGHSESLRTLCMHVEGLSEKETLDLSIPRSTPMVLDLDADLKLIKKYSLEGPKRAVADDEDSLTFCQYVKQRSDQYDLVVLGGGPAGVRAAEEAASRGQFVAIVEPKSCITGAPTGAHSKCLREAAMCGARTWEEVQSLLDRVIKNAHHEAMRGLHAFHIKVLKAKGSMVDETTVKLVAEDGTESTIKTDAVIIATGSKANRFPPTNFDLPGVYDSDTIQAIQRIPQVMVVQGAGIVSVEYALIFAKLGSKVTVIDAFPAFLPMLDECLQEAVRQTLIAEGIEIIMSTPFKSVEGGEGTSAASPKIKIDIGERQFEVDCLLSATGRHANTATLGLENLQDKGLKVNPRGKLVEVDYFGYTGCAKVYAVGDCATGSMGLATLGQAQAVRAARSLYTESGLMQTEKKQEVKPFGVWTIPDVAWAGQSEAAVRKQGIDYCVCKVKYNQTVRGCVTDEDGFLKLIYNREDGVVLGVHIFGENSCELINYGAEVVEKKSTIFEMLHFVFPAVTYHNLYVHAAAEGKLRLKGARCLAAATAWRRLQEQVEGSLKDNGDSSLTVLQKLKQTFIYFDEDSSGFLSRDQLHTAVEALGLKNVTEDDIQGMIAEATGDPNEDNVDYATFLSMLSDRKPTEDEIKAEEVGQSEARKKLVSKVGRKTLFMEGMDLNTDPDVFDLIVIGGGPAGVRAAEEGSSRGKKVALIEPKATIHGAPTGAHSKCVREAVLNGAKSWADVEKVLVKTMENAHSLTTRMFKTFHVEYHKGMAKLQDESTVLLTPNDDEEPEVLKASHIVIATGSKANHFPPVNFDLPGVFDSDTISTIDRVPEHLVVQGSGIVGVEYGIMFAMLGSKVTVVDAFPAFLPMLDEDLRAAVRKRLESTNIEVIMSTPFKSCEAGEGSTAASPKIKLDLGDRGVLECDALLSATGRSGNTGGLGLEELASKGLKLGRGKLIQVDDNGYTGCGGIYACGDCATGSMGLATMGQSQSVRAVRSMFSKSGLMAGEKKKEVKPSGVWTIPEVAWAGITEDNAKKEGLNYGVAKIEYGNTIRGCVSGEPGFLKLIFSRDGGAILGVHICGDLSCELVNYGAELVNSRSTIFELLHFVFPAVTHHELYSKAATQSKIRLRGVRDLTAATAWKRLQNLAKKAYEDLGSADTVEEALLKTFQKYDYDESGFLNRQQLRDVVAALGISMSEDDVVKLIVEANGDPKEDEVDYETMLKMLTMK